MVLSIFNRKKNILYKFVPKHIFQVIIDDIESKLAIKNILKDFTILSSKQHPSRAAGLINATNEIKYDLLLSQVSKILWCNG